jgi:hypothetical protein
MEFSHAKKYGATEVLVTPNGLAQSKGLLFGDIDLRIFKILVLKG